MSNTIVETILDTLGDEMEEFIKISRSYRTTPTMIYRGAFAPDEVSAFPIIGYDIKGENLDLVYQDDEGVAFIEIDIYGYAYSDGVDRISDIRNLAHDVLNFIHNDWSYTDTTGILDKIEYLGYKTLSFRLPIVVHYEWDYTTIK